jgi:hypothetical protein
MTVATVLRKPQPWKPADATDAIRTIAGGEFRLNLTRHAREQMSRRGLIVGDVTHVLKTGFVYEEPEATTRGGLYKYQMECPTPNGGARSVRTVVIPHVDPPEIKIVTVMWVDE